MKRRIISVMIALALCLSLCPTAALAVENTAERTVRTTQLNLTNEDAENTAEGWSWKRTDDDGYYYTLTLDNVNFEVPDNSAITFSMDKQTWLGAITIDLIGENRVVSTNQSENIYDGCGIFLDTSSYRAPLEIVVSGSGSLTVEGYRCGIDLGTDRLHFDGVTVDTQATYPSGLLVTNGGSLLIEDSKVSANTISATGLTSKNSDLSVVLDSLPDAWTYEVSLITAHSVDISGGALTLAGSEEKPAYNAISNAQQTSIDLSSCLIDIRNVQYGLSVNAGTINLTGVSGAVFCTESGSLLTSSNSAFHANEVNSSGCSIYAQTGSNILIYGDCSLPSEITKLTVSGDLIMETGKTFTIGQGQKVTFSKSTAQICQYIDNTTLINNGTLEFIHCPTFRSGTKLINNGMLIAPEGISYSKDPAAAQNAQVTNNGTFDGIVMENSGFTQYIYGDVTLGGNRALGALNGSRWMINKIFVMPDAVLTVPSGKTLDASQEGQGVTWDSLSEYLSVGKDGKIVVEEGGTLLLPPDPTREQLNSLPLTGEGTIQCGEVLLCTVTFDSQGGSEVRKQTTLSGQPVEKPADPTWEGYTFGGWYQEAACATAWDFDTYTVTGDVTLYAGWTKNHVHSYGPEWESDANGHWQECECGEKSGQAAHTPGDWITDQEATTAATGSKHKACTVCGYVMAIPQLPPEHTHSYGPEWKSDANGHWQECACGEKAGLAAHTPGNWIIDQEATSAAEGSKHKECTVCGYVTQTEVIPQLHPEHTHSYGPEWRSNATEHWHECECGEKSSEAAHTPGEWITDQEATATAAGVKHKECTVCGYVTETGTIDQLPTPAPSVYTVCFDTQVDGLTVPSQSVTEGDKAAKPDDPARSGYTFGGWYRESECVTAVDFDTYVVTGDVTFYAKWSQSATPSHPTASSRRPSRQPEPESDKPTMPDFTDVAQGAWYYDAVEYAVTHDLFNGTSDTTFSPNAPMTRAMLMTVLARLDGQETKGGDTWYAKGVAWAVAQGISDGTAPDSPITREQLAAMLYRYAKAGKPSGDLSTFTDANDVSGWALDAVIWAAENEIIHGKGGGVLDPKGKATRAEVAAMLMRYCELEK